MGSDHMRGLFQCICLPNWLNKLNKKTIKSIIWWWCDKNCDSSCHYLNVYNTPIWWIIELNAIFWLTECMGNINNFRTQVVCLMHFFILSWDEATRLEQLNLTTAGVEVLVFHFSWRWIRWFADRIKWLEFWPMSGLEVCNPAPYSFYKFVD